MTREDTELIIGWFCNIRQIADDRKTANGVVMEDWAALDEIKCKAHNCAEYIKNHCLQHSLPEGLDEAAEEYALDVKAKPYGRLVKDAFKAGAAWRGAQIPKLSENLDEAARQYGFRQYRNRCEGREWTNSEEDFKAGAEWMAGQGWKEVDTLNYPLLDKNELYCVYTKEHYLLATVIAHPKDDELLQWKCIEFPFHRYDMCEGDKYLEIRKK